MRLYSLLLLMPQLLLGTNVEYYELLFGTSDFALITQQNCARFIETSAGKSAVKCPFGLGGAPDLDTIDHDCGNAMPETVRPHLVRDVHRKHKPRVLFIYTTRISSIRYQINFNIVDLSLVGNNTDWTVPAALKVQRSPVYDLKDYEELVDTIFDTQSHILYVIVKHKHKVSVPRHLQIFYSGNIFGKDDEITFRRLERGFNVHESTANRFDFVENPYEHTVYYKQEKEGHIIISKLPISEVLSCLVDGKEGEEVTQIPDTLRTLIWAHKGAVITMERNNEETHSDIYYLRNTSDINAKSKRCRGPESTSAKGVKNTRRMITVFDWDYCVLAYQGNGMERTDGTRCPVYNNELASIDNSGSNNTIYIVVFALLMMLLLVMAVYICYLRRNMQDDSFPRDDHKPVPYYPSGQPLDSTFDMSVDRWDQY